MFIKVNGKFPQDPQLLLQEYAKMGWDTSVWRNVANTFHYNRGTTPSVGYFLLMKAEIPASSFSIEVNTTYSPPGKKSPLPSSDDSITIQGLVVADAKVINPIENPDKGIYLVKIIDPIVNRWSHTYVNQDFNIPIGTEQEELSPSNIITHTLYDKSTTNGDDPYTWQELFDTVSGQTIDTSQADFLMVGSPQAESIPEGFKFKNNADGRPMTVKQALDALLLITGHTIIRKPDATLELVPIDSSEVEETLSNFRSQFLRFDSHVARSRETIKIAEKIKFRFPKIAIGSTLDIKYTDIEKSFGQTPDSQLPVISGLSWLVKAPL